MDPEVIELLDDMVNTCQIESDKKQEIFKEFIKYIPIELNHNIIEYIFGDKPEKSEEKKKFDKVLKCIPKTGDWLATEYDDYNEIVSSKEEYLDQFGDVDETIAPTQYFYQRNLLNLPNNNELLHRWTQYCEICPSWMGYCNDCGNWAFLKKENASISSAWGNHCIKYTCLNGCTADFPCGCHIKKVYTHYGWVPEHTCVKHGILYQPPFEWHGDPYYLEDIDFYNSLIEQEPLGGIPKWWPLLKNK